MRGADNCVVWATSGSPLCTSHDRQFTALPQILKGRAFGKDFRLSGIGRLSQGCFQEVFRCPGRRRENSIGRDSRAISLKT